ncbi:MAG: nuclear transport factor 2 family protein, partial [Cytophagia bacterium]|nr:nuclear transport factor 2 family protein [Cytophagia bacterium]
ALIFLLFTQFSFAQTPEKGEVQQVITRFFNALSLTNIPQMKAEVSDDFILLENGEIWTIDTLANKISRPKPEGYLRQNSFDFIETKIEKNRAYVYYKNKAEISSKTKNATIKWLESAILRKEKGRWRMEFMHSTPMK